MVPSYSAMPIPGTYAVAKPDAFGTARPMSPRFANTGLIQMPRSPVMEPLELVPMEPAVEKVAKQPIVYMLQCALCTSTTTSCSVCEIEIEGLNERAR